MRIAMIHSYYRDLEKSGENNVVDSQISFLKKMGNEVGLFASSSLDNQESRFYELRASANVIFGIGDNPYKFLQEFDPDVIFMHNLFPNISTKWLHEFGERTFVFKHNYRDICASANLYRDNKICLKCVNGSQLNGVINKCYMNSAIKTLPIAIRNSNYLVHRPEITKPARFILLSNQMRVLLKASGIDESRCETVPNFVQDNYENFQFPKERNGRWVVAGRFVKEKGFRELINVWPTEYQLDIFGDGPLFLELKSLTRNHPNIQIKGSMNRNELHHLLPQYSGAIFPSRWYEPGPLVVLEYLSAGLPLISVGNWSGAAGLNDKHHIESSNLDSQLIPKMLLAKLNWMTSDLENQSLLQRKEFLSRYTPQIWYESLMKIVLEAKF